MKFYLALILIVSLFSGGRTYVVGVPAHYRNPSLIIVLHGHGSNGEKAIELIGIQPNTIVVAPNGLGNSWNACNCCGYAFQNQIDDVGFISSLIDEMIETYNVNPAKVFIIGFSNGGMMAHKLAGTLSNKIAAFADISGTIGGRVGNSSQIIVPDQPMDEISIFMVHGILDRVVPFNQDWNLPSDRYDLSFAQGVKFWKDAYNYVLQSRGSRTLEYEIDYYRAGMRGMVTVVFLTGGHELTMWDFVRDKILLFFNQHPKNMEE